MMQRYESYTPSGIPWVDELPTHWGSEKGKWVHRFKKDLNLGKKCDNVLSLTLRGVVNNDPDAPEGLVPKDYSTYQVFDKNDLVFKLIDLENFKTSRVGLVHEHGIMSSAYLRVSPGNEHNARYYYYYYFSLYQQGIYNKLGAGVRSTLGPTDLLELGVPLPPRAEQDRIVTFLDQKTAEIDTAIAKKEWLIELLQEQKSILINQAVTRGLDPDALMRDSGVEWIGQVPTHWESRRLKLLASFITSGPRGWSDRLSDEGAVFLQSGNLDNSLGVDMAGAHRVFAPKGAEAKRTRLQDGDVLICITGANTGRVAVARIDEQEAYINQHLSLVRLKAANPSFVAYSLSSQGRTYFDLCQYGLKEGLSLFDVANAIVILPSIREQDEIVKFLNSGVGQLDATIITASKQCDQLNELKKTIISEAVTGQLKQ